MTLSDLEGDNEFIRFIYSLERNKYKNNGQFLKITGSYFDHIRTLNKTKINDTNDKLKVELLLLFQSLYVFPSLGNVKKMYENFMEDKNDLHAWSDYLSQIEGIELNPYKTFISSVVYNLNFRLSKTHHLLDSINAQMLLPENFNSGVTKEQMYLELIKTLPKKYIKYYITKVKIINERASNYSIPLVDCFNVYDNTTRILDNIKEELISANKFTDEEI